MDFEVFEEASSESNHVRYGCAGKQRGGSGLRLIRLTGPGVARLEIRCF
jgi:hypothetical protein